MAYLGFFFLNIKRFSFQGAEQVPIPLSPVSSHHLHLPPLAHSKSFHPSFPTPDTSFTLLPLTDHRLQILASKNQKKPQPLRIRTNHYERRRWDSESCMIGIITGVNRCSWQGKSRKMTYVIVLLLHNYILKCHKSVITCNIKITFSPLKHTFMH